MDIRREKRLTLSQEGQHTAHINGATWVQLPTGTPSDIHATQTKPITERAKIITRDIHHRLGGYFEPHLRVVVADDKDAIMAATTALHSTPASSSSIELTRLRRQPPASLALPLPIPPPPTNSSSLGQGLPQSLPPPLLASPGHGGPGPSTTARRFFSFTTEEHPRHGSVYGHSPHHPHDHDPHDDHDHDHSAAAYADALAAIRPLWRRSLFSLLEHPTSSRAAFVVQMTSTALIVFSALVTVLETVPAVHSISAGVWFGVETSLVALFTVEYVARCVAWSYSWASLFHWVFSFYGVIDLLSVLPYYLELLLGQDTSVYFRFSILRMFRLLRVFRPFRYNHTILLTMEVMYLSVRRSQHALLAIGFFVFMILTVFSTLLYFAERGTWDDLLGTFVNVDGDPTQFSSIPAAAWFVLVTITTVGYGEITPRSFLGRLITLPILVFGLLLITLPSFVLGREFSVVWEGMTRGRKLEAEASRAASAENVSGVPITSANGRAGRGSREGAYEEEEDSENTPLTRGVGAGSEANTPDLGAGAWRQQNASRDRMAVPPASAPPAKPARDPLYSPVYSAMPSGAGAGMGSMMNLGLPAPYSAAGDYGFSTGSNPNGHGRPPSSPSLGLDSARASPRPGHARSNTQPYGTSHSQVYPPYDPTYAPPQESRHRSRIAGGGGPGRDLSNLKLAQNQTELSRQIEELAGAVEVQGRLLRVLVERLAVAEGRGQGSNTGAGVGEALVETGAGTGVGKEKEEES